MSSGQILVVEDNEKNMKLFRDVLQATGYATLEARTGEAAVDLAVAHSPARRSARAAARRRANGIDPRARRDGAGDAG